MKQIAVLTLILALALTACEGPQGPAGRDGQANWSIQYYVVGEYSPHYPSGAWTSLGDGRYQCLFKTPQLTDFIYNEGITLVSYMQDMDTDHEVQIGLPHIFFGSDPLPFTATYTFDTTPGYVAFNVAYSDFNNVPPPVCIFKLTLVW
ncbi:MAG: hypothetical protein LBC40_09065 [Dysgonamonadaceae bacterium]|nr:hypothetical protein [Dysgonamonadaceae bacterium]